VAALNLLLLARRADQPVRVLLLDRKIFTQYGPAGCNLCAGVISAALIHDLENLGVIIPPHVIQQKILGYEMVTRGGSVFLPRPPGSVIYTAYRGIGPRGLDYDEERSFDAFLLRSAIQAGAEYRNSLVVEIQRRGGGTPGFQLQCQDGEALDADVVIGAFGINSTRLAPCWHARQRSPWMRRSSTSITRARSRSSTWASVGSGLRPSPRSSGT
jgi:2-polyprenyl-6-methoxyphenol hydroxylase-like FAD-dependent oxidoreductase